MVLSDAVPLDRGVKQGYPQKRRYFTTVGLFSMKTVGDRHRHAAFVANTGDELFWNVNIDDLEPPK